MAQYPYLNDRNFLRAFDCENKKEQFIKIIVLDFKTEKPKANIEGKSTGGSCNLSGTSNMRRTCSCSLVVDPEGIKVAGYSNNQNYYNITEIQNLISLNKKIKILTGFTNTLKYVKEWEQYKNYDTIWYPLGTYVIKAASVSRNTSGINISLTLNDKCALLNGDMGGIFPAATVLSEKEEYNSSGTERVVTKLLIKDIIKNIVVEFGGESLDNVIITDIPDYATKVLKWNYQEPLYLYNKNNKDIEKYFSMVEDANKNPEKFVYGQDVTLTTTPFVYPGTLECKAGETVAAALDKIKNTLGNYEWYYDVEGRFHFQEIKNYLNTSQATSLINLQESDYLSSANLSKSVYTFDESNNILLTSISKSPQYQNIKNDFTVWGVTKTAAGTSKPIRYHAVFATKPKVSEIERLAIVYQDYRGLQAVLPLKEDVNYQEGKPDSNSNKDFFYIDKNNNNKVYAWDEEIGNFRTYSNYEVCYLKTNDWRTELYYQGLWESSKTFSDNPYISELLSEWPKIYNFRGELSGKDNKDIPIYSGAYRLDVTQDNYEYWLDFIEGSQGSKQSVSQFSVDNIGRRAKVVTDNNSNCLFPSNSQLSYILVEADGDTAEELRGINNTQEVIQVSPEIYRHFTLGGKQNDAFSKIKELILQYTSYNETVNMSIVPIYYLEPNTRITISDNSIGVNGDYLISTISLPLTLAGTSTIAATRCLEKTI